MTRRVLLVEDDITLRRIFSMVLAEAGYTVVEAAGAAEALELLGPAADGVDLLVSDNRMPGGMSGIELMRQARARRADLPMVGLAGAMPEREAMRLPELSGVCWLQKPIFPDRLLACVEELIGPARR